LDRVNSLIKKQALRRILDLDSEADIRRFRRALKYSVQGDGNLPPAVYSPERIADETGISIESQYEMWILLDRIRAISFLESLGRNVPPESFRKKLSATNHKKVIGRRRPARVGNSFVFTYLEILRIVGETRILVINGS
jgi:hypothetical protein